MPFWSLHFKCSTVVYLAVRAENAVKNRYNSLINRRWTEEMFTNAESAMQAQIYSGAGMGAESAVQKIKTEKAEAPPHPPPQSTSATSKKAPFSNQVTRPPPPVFDVNKKPN